jgi:pimeloyl-ACP methyl ester carboxylesterase
VLRYGYVEFDIRRLAVAAVLLAVGCGSASGSGAGRGMTTARSPGPSSAPGRHWPCLARFGARETQTGDGVRLALLGHGPVAVVLSNESDRDACGWAPHLDARRRHRELALYDDASDAVTDLASVFRFVRSRGVRTAVLIGASEGAKAAIVAAGRTRPAAIVSLSAEARLGGRPVAPYAARLAAPALFVTAAQDPYGAAAASRAFARVDRAGGRRLLTVPGTAHGAALLGNSVVRQAVGRFLAVHGA